MSASGMMIVEEVAQFNASITVTELLTKTLENCAKDLAIRCIMEAAGRHGFDGNEEIRALGLENLALIRKQMAKKSGSKVISKKEKPLKEKKTPVFPLPFVAEAIELTGCQGLAYNRGLFTQCLKKRMDNGNFCKGCQTEADKNASGCPDCGTVESRLACGLYEFKDPKGRSPVRYVKMLYKLKLSDASAIEAAGKLNIVIDEEHFVVEVVEKEKKTKGRPKKIAAVEADNVTDLFAKLSSEDDEEIIEFAESAKPVKKAKLSDEEKAVKKAALESERAEKKAEREAKLALDKAEREEKRKAELEQKKLEREAKLAVEKAEREAKRAQEKAEREAKKALEKASKGKKTAEVKPVEKPLEPVEKAVDEPLEPKAVEPAPTKVTVSRVQIAGKAYLKSSNNILYDPITREEVAIWDPETKTIKDLPEEDDEDEEEEYEEDDE
jgi:flagellar biosynthesis GTPase FlhF